MPPASSARRYASASPCSLVAVMANPAPGMRSRPASTDGIVWSGWIENVVAPNGRIVRINPANPAPANWVTVVPAKSDTIDTVGVAGGKLFEATVLFSALGHLVAVNRAQRLESQCDRTKVVLPVVVGVAR